MQIYFEGQQSACCAVHCINNMLQGAYFTEVELANIAHEIDEAERRLIAQSGMDGADYLTYMAADSNNVGMDGNFSIEVIRKALGVFGMVAEAIKHETMGDVRRDPGAETAFICHMASHWFCIRKLNDKWFKLNSLGDGPEHISDFYLSAYISQLQTDGYTIFVVRGSFPRVNEGLVGRGQWFPESMVMQGGVGKSRQSGGIGGSSSSSSSDQHDDDLQQALKLSIGLAGQGGADSNDDDDDDELQQALAMSMAQNDDELELALQMSLAQADNSSEAVVAVGVASSEPPPEPPADTDGVITVRIRLPSGKQIQRRFHNSSTFSDVRSFCVAEDPSLQNHICGFRSHQFGETKDMSVALSIVGNVQNLSLMTMHTLT